MPYLYYPIFLSLFAYLWSIAIEEYRLLGFYDDCQSLTGSGLTYHPSLLGRSPSLVDLNRVEDSQGFFFLRVSLPCLRF